MRADRVRCVAAALAGITAILYFPIALLQIFAIAMYFVVGRDCTPLP